MIFPLSRQGGGQRRLVRRPSPSCRLLDCRLDRRLSLRRRLRIRDFVRPHELLTCSLLCGTDRLRDRSAHGEAHRRLLRRLGLPVVPVGGLCIGGRARDLALLVHGLHRRLPSPMCLLLSELRLSSCGVRLRGLSICPCRRCEPFLTAPL